MTNSIIASPEIFGALVSSLDATDAKKFEDNPNSYLKDSLGVNTDVSVAAVKNSDKEVNIALPYYSAISKTADSLSDSDISSVSGGAGASSFHDAVSNAIEKTTSIMRDVADSIDQAFSEATYEETDNSYSLTINTK